MAGGKPEYFFVNNQLNSIFCSLRIWFQCLQYSTLISFIARTSRLCHGYDTARKFPHNIDPTCFFLNLTIS